MIQAVRPFVVGHFDLVRIHDPDYAARVLLPEIAAKIDRNLDLIKYLNLVMDLNLRPLAKVKNPIPPDPFWKDPIPADPHGARR